ncbi:MAG TPA: hypothetical protein VGN95_16495 [Pyrinomonadaceae bacterium]|nr:hypothetical protein [Pyrinomonadaceae bacterium]
MRLKNAQKKFLLARIAEGLETDEINARAAKFKPAFSVSRQQVDFYRASRGVSIKEIASTDEMEALRSGLALRSERVARLEKLFNRVEKDLLENDLVWLPRKRALGRGEFTEIIDELELNKAEMKVYRDLLDDIAKEMNARTYERRESLTDDSNLPEDLNELSDEELEEIANG